jgi:mevalonate kinase
MRTYHARGKLLLSAEYMVLHGAEALAVPLTRGQSMSVKPREGNSLLEWQAADSTGAWFSAHIDPVQWEIVDASSREAALRLIRLLSAASDLVPEFRADLAGRQVSTMLDYPRDYGFGSSSTLVSLVAQWSGCDPMELHHRTSEGSGYDVACADAESPIFYRKIGRERQLRAARFYPPFHEQIYFAWLGQKQHTATSLQAVRQGFRPGEEEVGWFTEISRSMAASRKLGEFRNLMEDHEQRLSLLLGIPPVSERFGDLEASLKSLGAWGGDFVMIASGLEEADLFGQLARKGLQQVYTYKDLVYGAKA